MMVGWLNPVVLLPASALSGLTPTQIEALLAHELAHVRRHDYLVNLLQSVVETLLFYHPAVWWVSAHVRAEREHCCDDLAVAVCDRLVYVTALADLAAMTSTPRWRSRRPTARSCTASVACSAARVTHGSQRRAGCRRSCSCWRSARWCRRAMCSRAGRIAHTSREQRALSLCRRSRSERRCKAPSRVASAAESLAASPGESLAASQAEFRAA